ncbi:hypothetical protein [Deinococcus humi]|uniref:Uncharacterized protein n=1 Tax=Deinococcus humi TaxID=662880 RepID=A0A7W8NBP7_9DEIO|nr:hypothetical protein [Deinococcus humi]MBB5361334.1 hypothetical protein [Deinococcus humi]GGO19522.1 hypothetical protein GCM10008949_03980 [Deinococcus humi]
MADAADQVIMAALRRAGYAAALELREKLSHPGAGVRHPGNLNPSSKPGDYPAIQGGRLAASIGAIPGPGLSVSVGAVNNPPPEARELIERPPSQGGRDYLTKALHDPDIHEAARRAVGL